MSEDYVEPDGRRVLMREYLADLLFTVRAEMQFLKA